jgi:hypothetical protein
MGFPGSSLLWVRHGWLFDSGDGALDHYEVLSRTFRGQAVLAHSAASWGRDHELDAMRNLLEQFPTGMVACVSDSYNIWQVRWAPWDAAFVGAVVTACPH